MIHSHWLRYKYFYGSVFLFLFPSLFSKKAVWMSSASRTHLIAPQIRESETWRNYSEFGQAPSPAFYRWGNWSPEKCRHFLEVTEWVPGRLWAGPLVSRIPEHSACHHTLSFSSAGRGSGLDRALLPTIRPQPQSRRWPENLKNFSSQRLTGILDHYFNEKVFLALLPGAFFQLTFRAAGFKLRGQNNSGYIFLFLSFF